VGLKDVRVLHYKHSGRDVELMIEQVVASVRCPNCGGAARVKERPLVRYIDLPVFGVPMHLAWKKHRRRCPNPGCPKRTFSLTDHRIAAKWATEQGNGGENIAISR
jgi:DNA-directed RNA polymerase subunit RPC12/RpoP